ncbi:hypothetical protein K1X84_00010 [bacterium]|nr:hypothetical protein [bacterium]
MTKIMTHLTIWLALVLFLFACGEDDNPAVISFDTVSLSFTSLPLNTNIDTSIVIANTGESNIIISSITFHSTDILTITTPFPIIIGGGTTKAITFRFNLNQTLSRKDTIVITSDAPNNPVFSIPVSLSTLSYEVTESGWIKYQAHNYAGAATDFAQAISLDPVYADALLGSGWTNLKTDNLNSALTNFNSAVTHGSTTDGNAGKAFAELNLNNFTNAISAVNAFITITSGTPTSYTFSRDNSINQLDMLWIRARAHYLNADFASAEAMVDILNPSNTLNSASPTYVADLADAIEQLRSVVL